MPEWQRDLEEVPHVLAQHEGQLLNQLRIVRVDHGHGRYQGQLAVYVKPRGRLGKQYMAFIAPFRHWVVYPALLRQIERAWQAR